MARLYGIDVSGDGNQPANIVSLVQNDFAIVKVSGNPQVDGNGRPLAWNYVNPDAKKQAADAMKKHGRLGLYHFTWGKEAAVEAEFFVKEVQKLGYLGKAMLIIDYEAQALDLGQTWVGKFAKRIEQLAGYKPVIYASGGVIISQSLFSLGYPIWCANYYKGYNAIFGYDTSDCKIYNGCEKSILWQYTSQGYLAGYDYPLDCNVFFGSGDDWFKYVGSSTPTPAPEPVKKISRANVAAQIMEHLCTCTEHGYSQPGRKGTSGYCTVQTDIGTIKVKKGDRDCSSAVCESWQLAIKGTPYEGKLDGATYTGNMESVFLDSGLFVKWNTATTEAVRGDVYLVHNSSRQHTAMCLDGGHDGVYGYDALGEFSIAETGDIDGVPGDQTGWESSIHEWYDFATVTLHYNGKADSEVTPTPEPTPTPQPTPSYKKGKYKVLVNNLNVRAKASTASQSVAKYQKGQTLIADKVVTKNGYVWASYIGRSSGKRRYVAIAKSDGSKKYMKHV